MRATLATVRVLFIHACFNVTLRKFILSDELFLTCSFTAKCVHNAPYIAVDDVITLAFSGPTAPQTAALLDLDPITGDLTVALVPGGAWPLCQR